jgi:hypothetical protein
MSIHHAMVTSERYDCDFSDGHRYIPSIRDILVVSMIYLIGMFSLSSLFAL